MRGKPFVVVAALAGVLSTAGCGGRGSFHPALVATLTPGAETEARGAPGASGKVRLTLDKTTGHVCWTVTYHGLADKPISAHVQQGKAGQTGADVIPLGGAFARSGCLTAPPKSVSALGRNPGRYYVNIYSRKYLRGAMRGQLAAVSASATTTS